jgi:hypothetical protein
MTHVQDLVTELCTRMAWSTAAGTQRTRALKEINRAEKWIAQQGSFLYLSKRDSLTLNNGASSVAAPSDYDYGKAAAIVGDSGLLEYKKLGDFDAIGMRTGGNMIRTDRPGYWTFAFATSTATIFLKPANTSGSNLSLTFTYQRRVAALTDATNSYSLLPETYEDTILLDRAEYYAKKMLGIPMGAKFIEELDSQLATFFGAQRTTNPESQPDGETEAAKIYETQLQPGV